MTLPIVSMEWNNLTKVKLREEIKRFEEYVLALPKEQQFEIPAENFFWDGTLVRTVHIPKNSQLVGEISSKGAINIITKGKLLVATEDGVKLIEGPQRFISKAGIKRAGIAIEDTIWTTVHRVESTTEDAARKELTTPDYSKFKILEESI
jgi:hypothetical protein